MAKEKVNGKGKRRKVVAPIVPADGSCLCGCGVKPRQGKVLQGHDGRIAGWIRSAENGNPVNEKALLWHAAWVSKGKPGGNHPKVLELV